MLVYKLHLLTWDSALLKKMLKMHSKLTNTPEDSTQEKRCKRVLGGSLADSANTEGGAGDDHGPVDVQRC